MTPDTLSTLMEATWPALRVWQAGPWMLRDGAGGGKRVSAATAIGAWSDADVTMAETAMRDVGQTPLFLIRAGDGALDATLAARGYAEIDPVVAYSAPVTAFDAPVAMTTFPHWPPLSIAETLWENCGTGPARIAVMHRAEGARCVILARTADRPSGVAFVACQGPYAMVHALEVVPALRRQGAAQNMLRAAAHWAAAQGAGTLALVVTQANHAARTLYGAMGMTDAGHYHYRQLGTQMAATS